MGTSYDLRGKVIVYDNDQTNELIKWLREESGLEFEVEHTADPPQFYISVASGDHMSYYQINDIDETLEKLGKHVIGKAGCFEWCVGSGESGRFFVGSAVAKRQARRAFRLQEAKAAYRRLRPEERKAFLNEIIKKKRIRP